MLAFFNNVYAEHCNTSFRSRHCPGIHQRALSSSFDRTGFAIIGLVCKWGLQVGICGCLICALPLIHSFILIAFSPSIHPSIYVMQHWLSISYTARTHTHPHTHTHTHTHTHIYIYIYRPIYIHLLVLHALNLNIL